MSATDLDNAAAVLLDRPYGPLRHEWESLALLLQNEANAWRSQHVPYNSQRGQLLTTLAQRILANEGEEWADREEYRLRIRQGRDELARLRGQR